MPCPGVRVLTLSQHLPSSRVLDKEYVRVNSPATARRIGNALPGANSTMLRSCGEDVCDNREFQIKGSTADLGYLGDDTQVLLLGCLFEVPTTGRYLPALD
jgi:hypothetical protein